MRGQKRVFDALCPAMTTSCPCAKVGNSGEPALQIRAHEGVVVEVRIGRADAVDLLLLSRSQRLAGSEKPEPFGRSLAAQVSGQAGNHAVEVFAPVKDP